MIRECAAPEYAIELQPNYDFKKFTINCVRLAGLTYKIDTKKVHLLIHRFVQGKLHRRGSSPKVEIKIDGWNTYNYWRTMRKKVTRRCGSKKQGCFRHHLYTIMREPCHLRSYSQTCRQCSQDYLRM